MQSTGFVEELHICSVDPGKDDLVKLGEDFLWTCCNQYLWKSLRYICFRGKLMPFSRNKICGILVSTLIA